jgi:replicative DNA helicase
MNASVEKITTLKTPPHSIESEQAILAALMGDGSKWDHVAELVTAADFYRKEHKLIFDAMAKQAGKPIDVITISEVLRDTGKLAEAGGIDYLAELLGTHQSAANIAAYAKIVRERSLLRSLISAAHSIADSAYNADGRTSEELLAAAGTALGAIEQGGDDKGPAHIWRAMTASFRAFEIREKNQGKIHGLVTGFADLDAKLGGLIDGDLILIAGRPSMGKTTLACNIAENVGLAGKPVIIFSLEMSERKLADRMFCSVGRVDAQQFRTAAGIPAEDSDRLTAAAGRIKQTKIYIDDSSMLSSAQLLGRARRVQRQLEEKPALIVVDYLQILRDKGEGVDRVTRISANLKQLAREMSCPVIALSQLNRQVENRAVNDRRPVMADLRDSGALEQDADVILMLYREEVYQPETMQKGIAECLVRKNRDGEIGTVLLSSALHRNRFENLAPGYRPPSEPNKRRGGYDYE